MNEDFGLKVEEPFHIISALPEGRFLDIINRQLVIKSPNGRHS